MSKKGKYSTCFGFLHVSTATVIVCFFQFLYIDFNIILYVFFHAQALSSADLLIRNSAIILFTLFYLPFLSLPLLDLYYKKTTMFLCLYKYYLVIYIFLSFAMFLSSVFGFFLDLNQLNYVIGINLFASVVISEDEALLLLIFFTCKNFLYLIFGTWSFLVIRSCKKYIRSLKNNVGGGQEKNNGGNERIEVAKIDDVEVGGGSKKEKLMMDRKNKKETTKRETSEIEKSDIETGASKE